MNTYFPIGKNIIFREYQSIFDKSQPPTYQLVGKSGGIMSDRCMNNWSIAFVMNNCTPGISKIMNEGGSCTKKQVF